MKLDSTLASSVGWLTCLSKWERDSWGPNVILQQLEPWNEKGEIKVRFEYVAPSQNDLFKNGVTMSWLRRESEEKGCLVLLMKSRHKVMSLWSSRAVICAHINTAYRRQLLWKTTCASWLNFSLPFPCFPRSLAGEQWLNLRPLEICQGAVLILSLESVNLILRSWVSLALKTTCYLYALLTVQTARLFALWLGFQWEANKHLPTSQSQRS